MGEFILNTIILVVIFAVYYYRKNIWKHIEAPVYGLWAFFLSLFSKKIYWKYYKLVTFIIASEHGYRIIKREDDEISIETMDDSEKPIVLWTVCYDYSLPKKQLKVICELLECYNKRVFKVFHLREDLTVVFNSMIYAINDLRIRALNK